MAEITAALLCDFAQVREGLLFVSSGGLTRLLRPELPTHLGVYLAIVVEVPADELRDVHELSVTVRHADATPLAKITATLQLPIADTFPGESFSANLVVPLVSCPAPSWGPYDVSVSVDNQPGRMLTAYVVRPV